MLLVPEGVRELETERRWKLFQGVSWLRTLVLNTEMRDLTKEPYVRQPNQKRPKKCMEKKITCLSIHFFS